MEGEVTLSSFNVVSMALAGLALLLIPSALIIINNNVRLQLKISYQGLFPYLDTSSS